MRGIAAFPCPGASGSLTAARLGCAGLALLAEGVSVEYFV
jgi:hypothetical protein